MPETVKIGIVICDRYRRCAGGKCFRAMKNREGAFNIYDRNIDLEIVGYTTCDGCPGGNIEYAGDEMVKNGAQVIHFATGLIVGYPPCPYIETFKTFLENKYSVKVILGTHPIPQKYVNNHEKLGTWKGAEWQKIIEPTWADDKTRLDYD